MIVLGALSFFAATAAGYLSNGIVIIPGATSYNGLNLVPQMGWDNWNAFGCSVSADLLTSTAASIANNGLRDLGYNYVILDDCWSSGRNSTGYLEANELKFPGGMAPVADYIHNLGLKFGMYSSAGIYTCGKYPGSLGYETQDAEYWASVGVDYLKYDNCYNMGQSGTPKLSFDRYNVMSLALNKTGRPIVYSLCNWGNDDPYDWAYGISNSGRMSGDIFDSFNRPTAACPCTTNPCNWPGYQCSVMNILNKMAPITSRTQSGYFNDMDMLEVGNGGMTDSEYVIHFSMWAMMSSPLIMGTDIRTLTPGNYSIYANPAVIAVNQDPSANAAYRVYQKICNATDTNGQCETDLFVRTMANGDQIVAMINGANVAMTMPVTLQDIFGYNQVTPAASAAKRWDIYDLWGNRMNTTEAGAALNGTAPLITATSNSTTRYNATALPYAQGLTQNNTALFGKMVGTFEPGSTMRPSVPRHSMVMWRLRLSATQPMQKRDEL